MAESVERSLAYADEMMLEKDGGVMKLFQVLRYKITP